MNALAGRTWNGEHFPRKFGSSKRGLDFESIADRQCTADAVLMKPITPVGSAIRNSPSAKKCSVVTLSDVATRKE